MLSDPSLRAFKGVVKLIMVRLKELRSAAIIHFWHNAILELCKYLMLRRI